MRALLVLLSCLMVGLGVWWFVGESREDSPIETTDASEAKSPSSGEEQGAPASSRLEFDDVPLSDILRILNQSNATQIELADSAIGETRITATLRSDNPDVFVSLLELTMDIRAVRVNASRIVLYRKEGV